VYQNATHASSTDRLHPRGGRPQRRSPAGTNGSTARTRMRPRSRTARRGPRGSVRFINTHDAGTVAQIIPTSGCNCALADELCGGRATRTRRGCMRCRRLVSCAQIGIENLGAGSSRLRPRSSLPEFAMLMSSTNADATAVDDAMCHAFMVLDADSNDLITPTELAHILRLRLEIGVSTGIEAQTPPRGSESVPGGPPLPGRNMHLA
jgi:hypothetical protein